ncbi:hypothetical protein FGO68_gene8902 [Halteria grandinella]|uniref:Uncharacterized protein n=1 Tax=Halteria grandinella TaxID=5974 RepID=A0A8J8SZW6_HALGN|nr:hypothetical protein FGO68_gene8902 [Halteria grandinella]
MMECIQLYPIRVLTLNKVVAPPQGAQVDGLPELKYEKITDQRIIALFAKDVIVQQINQGYANERIAIMRFVFLGSIHKAHNTDLRK